MSPPKAIYETASWLRNRGIIHLATPSLTAWGHPSPSHRKTTPQTGKTPCPGSLPSPHTWCAWRLRRRPWRDRGYPQSHDVWMISGGQCQRHPPEQIYPQIRYIINIQIRYFGRILCLRGDVHEAEVRAGKPSKAVLAAAMPLEDASASQLNTPKGVIWVIAHIVISERTGGWDQLRQGQSQTQTNRHPIANVDISSLHESFKILFRLCDMAADTAFCSWATDFEFPNPR